MIIPPSELADVPGDWVPKYAVTADGQRFLGIERIAGSPSFTFLLNWQDTTNGARAQ